MGEVLAAIGLWLLGAFALLIGSAVFTAVMFFLLSPECRDAREGVGFLLIAGALIAGLIAAPFALGGFILERFAP